MLSRTIFYAVKFYFLRNRKYSLYIDNDVTRLRMLKSEHDSQHYRLEDEILKILPKQILGASSRVSGIEEDIAAYKAEKEKCTEIIMVNGAASVTAKFPGMTINGVTHIEKEPAAKALIEACKSMDKKSETPIGEYMGFKLSLQYESFGQSINLYMRGVMTYKVELSTDTFGNITRINNALDKLPERLADAKDSLANAEKQMAAAKEELTKPFTPEDELAAKSARLALLNSKLNIDGGDPGVIDGDEEEPETGFTFPHVLEGTPPPAPDYAEPRTGTYGKARPDFMERFHKFGSTKRGGVPTPQTKATEQTI